MDKIDPISPTRTAINRELNANWCGVRGLEGTTCLYVPEPYLGFNALTQTKRKAPFPDDEVTGLVRLMANIQKEFDLTLTCSNDNITQDGRFATTLAINYDQFVENVTYAKTIAYIKNYDKKYDYSLKPHNCVHAAFNSLNFSGILQSFSFPNWASPNSIFYGIKILKNDEIQEIL